MRWWKRMRGRAARSLSFLRPLRDSLAALSAVGSEYTAILLTQNSARHLVSPRILRPTYARRAEIGVCQFVEERQQFFRLALDQVRGRRPRCSEPDVDVTRVD